MGVAGRGTVAIVTGSGGLVGAETVRKLTAQGLEVVGIDNDMRSLFFGPGASTRWQVEALRHDRSYVHVDADIRDTTALKAVFSRYGHTIAAVVHCAAQPSPDWALRDPATDITVNVNGTLALLEATRTHAPGAAFVFVSTNRIYGERPNELPMFERETRLELVPEHIWSGHGIPEAMAIDASPHDMFGASKAAADLLVQEYGHSYAMATACFRAGCITGPGHPGAQAQGILSHLVECAVTDRPFTVAGHGGKQLHDNLHVRDLADAFWCFIRRPSPGAVFNIGGGRRSNCSMLEAIDMAQMLTGRPMQIGFGPTSRTAPPKWWISDTRRFRKAYPEWKQRYDVPAIMADIHGHLLARGTGQATVAAE